MFHTSDPATLFAAASAPQPAAQDTMTSVVPLAMALVALLVLILVALAMIVIVLMRMNHRRRAAHDRSNDQSERPLPDPWTLAGERLKTDHTDED